MYSRVVRNVGVREKWVNLKHQIRKSSAFVPKDFQDTRSICFESNRLSGYSLIGGSKFSYIYQKHTRPMATYKGKLNYKLITTNEKEEVVEFLKKNFYADEPITRYIDVLGNPNSVKSLSQFSTKSLGQNISLLTRSETGELVGICLNSIKAKDDPEDEPITDPIFGKIAKLLGFAYEESKVFEKFPDIDRVLSVDIISVDREFQGHGIAKILMDKTRDLAREKGIKMIRVDCTSYFSARASEKLGMECVYELKYADYKEDGVQVFNPEPPHTGLKVYVQRLD
ncbi:Acetyltransferase [Oryctes borbonicus]|uniref:aralkylamine N-acetyltransferase n=1 Tax=Oryctes borbonicus TaxID=1629725 RepID=A0A0T6B4G5_9SCAR|nr:Acetyltransferase [Oryctes borbonicus]